MFPRNPAVVPTELSESLILLSYALCPFYIVWRPRLILIQLISNSKSHGVKEGGEGAREAKLTRPFLRHPLGTTTNKQTPWPEFAGELYRQSNRSLSAKLVPTFVGRGCHVVNVTNFYCRILGFLDRSRYFIFQVAPQLFSRA
jgi:hypothetical protein